LPFPEQDHPAPTKLISARRSRQANVEVLSRLSAARLEYREARRELIESTMLSDGLSWP
jgi:hypothetical protein